MIIPEFLKNTTTEETSNQEKVTLTLSGEEVHCLKDLREHFNMEEILKYMQDKTLVLWLNQHYYENEAHQLSQISLTQPDCKRKICRILGVAYEEHAYTEEEQKELEAKREKLKEFTKDENILKDAYIVAMNQEELANLIDHNEKKIYFYHRRNKSIVTILYIIALFIIWRNELKDIITLISFISAAITLAARDIIYNYFCGIYIKFIKPIKIEDRIKVGDTIGDIININALSFELLEVDVETNQSTGKIIHIPNSQIFNSAIKNYNTAFKYIWDEISINISVDSDVNKAKKILLRIVNGNNIIKEIPRKMKEEIKNSNSDYRIYYNKLTPIIYTKLVEHKIILTVRFLIHPKKQRNVESEIYEKIIFEFKKNNITIM